MQTGFQEEHKQMCAQWCTAKTEEDATTIFRKIRGCGPQER